jgi:prepilin-type N-terminal cleavage/methylation domain-containing protein
MRPGTQIPCSDNGFTLIEIIVTILLASVMAALMFQFMGTAMTGSSGPVDIVRDGSKMEALMEEMISEYVEEMNTNPSTALQTISTSYASNSSVTMAYIEFDAGGNEAVPASPPTDTLKVTVQAAGHSLVTLLTNSRAETDDPVSKY